MFNVRDSMFTSLESTLCLHRDVDLLRLLENRDLFLLKDAIGLLVRNIPLITCSLH